MGTHIAGLERCPSTFMMRCHPVDATRRGAPSCRTRRVLAFAAARGMCQRCSDIELVLWWDHRPYYGSWEQRAVARALLQASFCAQPMGGDNYVRAWRATARSAARDRSVRRLSPGGCFRRAQAFAFLEKCKSHHCALIGKNTLARFQRAPRGV